MSRRIFIKNTVLGSIATSGFGITVKNPKNKELAVPRIISTWKHGVEANKISWKKLKNGEGGLTAVEYGVRDSENNPDERSVGYGGLPDREGKVTLDACIMNSNNDCGSVSFLENIKNPISVARLVMEKTPHVMLSGKGAYDFAIKNGFKRENLLTEQSKKDWVDWLKKSEYKPVINIENHDTISMLLIDSDRNLFGACTTSGAAWKMHGRVGDSPIIGAGLFLDNDVGAAAATGLGEAVIRTAGSAMVVECMRNGMSPLDACKEVVHRISKLHRNRPEWEYLQVGFIALSKSGDYAGYSLKKGFNFALTDDQNDSILIDAKYRT